MNRLRNVLTAMTVSTMLGTFPAMGYADPSRSASDGPHNTTQLRVSETASRTNSHAANHRKADAAEATSSSSGVLHALRLAWVFDTAPYPPRWHCGNWSAAMGWLHILSDIATWLAYLAIPSILIFFVRRYGELPFHRLFWLFSAFILSCGTTHLMEAIIFWWPAYGLAGVLKLMTALVSIATAIALCHAIPTALQFKSPRQLEREVSQRTQELDIAREQATRIIEASPAGMIMVNQAGIIVLTNQAAERLFGYTREALQGSPVEILVPEPFRAEHPRFRQQYMQNPSTRHMGRGRELFGVHKSGEEIPIEIGLNPVDSQDGPCVLCSVLDLRERQQSAAEIRRHAKQLSRANEDLERFAYVASHDLKSPLRAIDNLSKWVVADVGSDLPEKSRTHLKQLRSRVGRMECLLDGLLAYSRAGRKAEHSEPIDCRVLIQEIVETLDIPDTFRVVIGHDMPCIVGKKSALQQVLMNLIGNAVKHHDRRDGEVRIEAIDCGSAVQFLVEDDGPGIAEEFHERAFEAFQTLKPRDKVEGSGLGLTIVKRVVELESGDIELTSSPGAGAQFRITWPKSFAEKEATTRAVVL